MVGVEPPAPIAARRDVGLRSVSAKRSWPPRCGRFSADPPAPEAIEVEKALPPAPESIGVEKTAANGVVEGRAGEAAGHAGVSSVACDAPPTQPTAETEVEEGKGGELQSPGHAGVRIPDCQGESRAVIDVMPLAFAAPQNRSVAAANVSVEDGRDGAGLLPVEGKAGQGIAEPAREEGVTDDGDEREMGSRVDDCGSKREEDGHDGGRQKRQLMSADNLPPKRRAVVSAIRRFPAGCGKDVVPVAGSGAQGELVVEATPISYSNGGASVAVDAAGPTGQTASPVLKLDPSSDEIKGTRVCDEEAYKAHNRVHESQLISSVVGDVVTKDSPRHGFARDDQSPWAGTPKTLGREHVDVNSKNERLESDKMDETSLDSGDGESPDLGDGESSQAGTCKTLGRGHVDVNSMDKRLGSDKMDETMLDDVNLGTSRGAARSNMNTKAIARVSQSHTPKDKSLAPKNKLKQKFASTMERLPPELSPSKFTMDEIMENKEDSCSRDNDNSMALVVYKKRKGKEISGKELEFNITPIVPSGDRCTDPQSKVRWLLRTFHCLCRKLLKAEEQQITTVGRIDMAAVNVLKKSKLYTKPGAKIGDIPGVKVGDEFHFRIELAMVGLHRPYQGGIDAVKKDGVLIAISVVASGAYPDELSSSHELIYTGSGGKAIGKKEAEDQQLKRGNLGLKNCIVTQSPVRVIHGFKGQSRGDKCKKMLTYTYDGLYDVKEYWQEGPKGSMVYKFKLQRRPGQDELALHIVQATRKSKFREGLCVPDISEGKERIPICVINNTVDTDARPAPFKYTTKVIYPPSYAKKPPKGCDCTKGCSDSSRCACAVRNGGEIPFNFNGAIVQAKPLIYECGPSCRCPPTCHNRVSQRGIKIPLEIFKTENRGWGVRSLSSISSGSFICEYTGELLQDSEAEKRDNDEYLFDIGQNFEDKELHAGLSAMIPDMKSSASETMEDDVICTIDAAKYGNIGRFINHSCLPNLYAQDVLWDHDDKMPHVMFFAVENIPPLQELTYHYNYKVGQVLDINGQEKVKSCFCGAPGCSGRLY